MNTCKYDRPGYQLDEEYTKFIAETVEEKDRRYIEELMLRIPKKDREQYRELVQTMRSVDSAHENADEGSHGGLDEGSQKPPRKGRRKRNNKSVKIHRGATKGKPQHSLTAREYRMRTHLRPSVGYNFVTGEETMYDDPSSFETHRPKSRSSSRASRVSLDVDAFASRPASSSSRGNHRSRGSVSSRPRTGTPKFSHVSDGMVEVARHMAKRDVLQRPGSSLSNKNLSYLNEAAVRPSSRAARPPSRRPMSRSSTLRPLSRTGSRASSRAGSRAGSRASGRAESRASTSHGSQVLRIQRDEENGGHGEEEEEDEEGQGDGDGEEQQQQEEEEGKEEATGGDTVQGGNELVDNVVGNYQAAKFNSQNTGYHKRTQPFAQAKITFYHTSNDLYGKEQDYTSRLEPSQRRKMLYKRKITDEEWVPGEHKPSEMFMSTYQHELLSMEGPINSARDMEDSDDESSDGEPEDRKEATRMAVEAVKDPMWTNKDTVSGQSFQPWTAMPGMQKLDLNRTNRGLDAHGDTAAIFQAKTVDKDPEQFTTLYAGSFNNSTSNEATDDYKKVHEREKDLHRFQQGDADQVADLYARGLVKDELMPTVVAWLQQASPQEKNKFYEVFGRIHGQSGETTYRAGAAWKMKPKELSRREFGADFYGSNVGVGMSLAAHHPTAEMEGSDVKNHNAQGGAQPVTEEYVYRNTTYGKSFAFYDEKTLETTRRKPIFKAHSSTYKTPFGTLGGENVDMEKEWCQPAYKRSFQPPTRDQQAWAVQKQATKIHHMASASIGRVMGGTGAWKEVEERAMAALDKKRRAREFAMQGQR